MIESVFLEISLVIILAVLISGIMKLLKQPLIIGYIITGIVSGPLILNLVKADEIVTVFSHFGIVFLLFIAGLSLNPKVLRSVGKVSLITGLGQVAFTSIIGFVICVILGFNYVESLYISIALTFSSTIIIIKLLSDKGDLQTLYGRISVGFLIVQDVIAVLMLMIISSFTNGFEAIFSLTLETVLIGAGTLTFIALFSYYALPRITGFFSDSQEFLLLFAIGWLLLLAIIFSYLNFSIEIGALIAGITMSISPYHFEIKSKMNVLRDFFILFFFVLLGSQMVFTNISNYVLPIIIFSLFILVGNPLIVMILMGSMRYTKRNGFLAGLTVAQISEFSLILVSLGVAVGHVTNDTLSLITATGLITIFGSAYLITHANKIYSLISGYLWIFERKGRKTDEHYHGGDSRYDIILFGYNRMGFSLLESLKHLKRRMPGHVHTHARGGTSHIPTCWNVGPDRLLSL